MAGLFWDATANDVDMFNKPWMNSYKVNWNCRRLKDQRWLDECSWVGHVGDCIFLLQGISSALVGKMRVFQHSADLLEVHKQSALITHLVHDTSEPSPAYGV